MRFKQSSYSIHQSVEGLHVVIGFQAKRVTLQLKVETFTLTWTTRKALLYTRFGEMITCILLVKRLHVICFASASGEMFGIRT